MPQHPEFARTAQGLTASPGLQAYDPEDFWLPSDGDDWSHAFHRIQAATDAQGATIQLACEAIYRLKSPIHICSAIRLIGCGTGRGATLGSSFEIRNGEHDGIITHQASGSAGGHCPLSDPSTPEDERLPAQTPNGFLTLQHLAIHSYGWSTTSTPTAALRMNTRFSLEDVLIVGPGITYGVRIRGNNTDVPKTGTNIWYMEQIDIYQTEGPAVFVDGHDSNAGLGILVNTKSNCMAGEKWLPHFETEYCAPGGPLEGAFPCTDKRYLCAGILDASFLGNTWLASHTAHVKDWTTGLYFAGISRIGTVQEGLGLGEYSEFDSYSQGVPNFNGGGASIQIGGTSKWRQDGGPTWHGLKLSKLILVNGNVWLYLGGATNAAKAAIRVALLPKDMDDLVLMADTAKDNWQLRTIASGWGLRIMGNSTPSYARGDIWGGPTRWYGWPRQCFSLETIDHVCP